MPKATTSTAATKTRRSSRASKPLLEAAKRTPQVAPSGRKIRNSLSPHVCHLCSPDPEPRCLGQAADLKRHIKTVHQDRERYKCHWLGCDYANGQKANLKTHITSRHSKVEMEQCQYGCSAKFHVLEDRDNHHNECRSRPAPEPRHARHTKPLPSSDRARRLSLPSPPPTPDVMLKELEPPAPKKRKAAAVSVETPVKKARVAAAPSAPKPSKWRASEFKTPALPRRVARPPLPTPPSSAIGGQPYVPLLRDVRALPVPSNAAFPKAPKGKRALSCGRCVFTTACTCASSSASASTSGSPPRVASPMPSRRPGNYFDAVRDCVIQRSPSPTDRALTPTDEEVEELEAAVLSRISGRTPYMMSNYSSTERRAMAPMSSPPATPPPSVHRLRPTKQDCLRRAAEIMVESDRQSAAR